MNISKEQLLFGSVIILLLAIAGGVTYFYFWDKLEKYAQDKVMAEQLERTYQEFREAFHDIKPQVLITEIQQRTQPWMEARLDWGQPFNVGDWATRYEPMKEEQYPRFWYDVESQRMLDALREKIRVEAPRLGYPANLRETFGVPTLDDWKSVDVVTERTARRQLSRLSYCIAMFEFLLEYQPYRIFDMKLWPNRTERVTGAHVVFVTTGLHFSMSLEKLVQMLEKLRLEDRYFTVDAIKITWPMPWYEPALEVQMLLTQANWVPPDRRPSGPGEGQVQVAAGPTPQTPMTLDLNRQLAERRAEQQARYQEPGFFGKIWRWIKRNIFVVSG